MTDCLKAEKVTGKSNYRIQYNKQNATNNKTSYHNLDITHHISAIIPGKKEV